MKLKKKEYLLRIEPNAWVELEKYSKENDLNISQIIRKLINKLIKGRIKL